MKSIDLEGLLPAISNLAVMTERLLRPFDVMNHNGTLWFIFIGEGSSLLRSLDTIDNVVKGLAMPATVGALSRYRTTLRKLYSTKNAKGAFGLTEALATDIKRDLDHITMGLKDEISNYLAFVVPRPSEGSVDNPTGLLGVDVIAAFPDVRDDIISATRCQTFELWTASVMHTMRVAERGVAAFADHLTVPVGNSWGFTIAEVIKALDDAKGHKGDPALQIRLKADPSFRQWASEAASYLSFVKDAFRNPAMHPELNFNREQAIAIFDNTVSFMGALATRIHGIPIGTYR